MTVKRTLACSLDFLTAVLSGTAFAQSAKDLIGTWQHVANVNTSADGQKSDTFGKNPKGIAIFSSDGHFIVVNHRPELPKFASNNRMQGTADENKAIVQGSIALYGTYTVNGKELTMKVDGSTYPDGTGTDQKRTIVSYSPDEIKWELAASIGGKSEVTWRKIK
jgi:hypothetical protein